MTHTILQPAEWPRPSGYANGIAARGSQIFIAGQIGWDASHQFPDATLGGQVRRALEKAVPLQELYFSPDWFLGENEPALLARAEAAGAQLFELSKEAFAKVAYRERPDGLL